ncbi:restriction endonuclease subunit S [Streptomyces coeruleorubidus]|uniref:restriction endonuclease subunit S n=1 Tax=Streptomyces coeruleorubidus TaxID=116188 RepID=UPI0033B53354
MSEVLGIALPSGWEVVPLKHLTSVLNRGSTPNYVDDGPVRAISQAANQTAGLDWSRTRFHGFAGDPMKLKGALQFGDVLINSTGTGTLGRVGYFTGAPDNIPCMADSHITVARAKTGELDSRFAYYWLSSAPSYQYIYAALVVGATNQIELNRDRLGDAPVPLPPLEEQRRIANFLDTETAKIDALVSKKRRLVELLEERSDSRILRHVGASALVARSTHLPVQPVRRLLAKVVRPPVADVGTVTAYRDGHVTERTLRRAEGYTLSGSTEPQGQYVIPGDVVIHGLDGFAGAIGVSEAFGNCSPVYHVCEPQGGGDSHFFGRMLRLLALQGYLGNFATSTRERAVDFRNWEHFGRIPLPAVPMQEQRGIGAAIRRIRPLKELVERSAALAAERRQALITAAVTGQFDVSTTSGRNVTEGITA